MIVLGADTDKRSHTIAAVAAATGELLGEQTVGVGGRGFDALLVLGTAALTMSWSGRSRIAGTCPGRWSAS